VKFPSVYQNQCCIDTINFCIRWTFTDTTCRTCDTLICYTLTQQWQGGTGGGVIPGGNVIPGPDIQLQWQQPIQQEMIKPKKKDKKSR
jgi:hypothetical protein